MELNDLYISDSRLFMVHRESGRQYQIKKKPDKEYYYIQHSLGQLTVTSSVKDFEKEDCVYRYIFRGGFKNFQCPAMDYWIYRHRLGNRISVSSYKAKFNVKLLNR